MKNPNDSKLYWTYKSLSQERFHRGTTTAGAHGYKPGQKEKNLKRFKSNFVHKSQSTIGKSELVVEIPELQATDSKNQLIPTPRTPKQPQETLRKSLTTLKSSQWNVYEAALRDIVQISRFTPELLEKSMPEIYKGIIKLLKSLRISAARTACQATNELFMNIQSGQSPEFEELVHTLLQKAGDSNKQVQKDALEALNSMIIHCPPSQSIKTLLHRRIAGCNLGVRTTASKLLACLFDDSDANTDTALNQETKIRLVAAAKKFLQDDSNDIKYYGKRLLTTLLQHKDFQNIFQKTSADSLHRVNKII